MLKFFFLTNVIQAMTKKQKDQQEAIWELLSTEAAYISKLYVIKKVSTEIHRIKTGALQLPGPPGCILWQGTHCQNAPIQPGV